VNLASLEKSQEIVRHDRAVGSGIAFGTFIVLVAALIFGLRKLRSRALAERAERELREDIDRLGGA
jgi:hypothetical protein